MHISINVKAISFIAAALMIAGAAWAVVGPHAVESAMLGSGWHCTQTILTTSCRQVTS